MKTSLIKLALVALVLGAPVAVQAQTDTTNPIATSPVKSPSDAPAAKTMAKKMAKTPYKGTVKSVDASSIVVTTASGDMTFALDMKTKYKCDGKMCKPTDITVGEKVTGSFMKDDSGAMTACSVHGHTK